MFQTESTTKNYVTDFIYLVYGWMTCALAITAGVAYYTFQSPVLVSYIFSSFPLLIGIFIGQLALVIALSSMINRLSYASAVALFIVYAASLGVTLSSIFVLYELGSIGTVLAVTAGTFGVTAVYGYVTKVDLTAMGSYLRMGLIGVIIALLVNMFFGNSTFDFLISICAVGVFVGLTAYDMQMIKRLAVSDLGEGETRSKYAVIGALQLYLDFVNLFLHLLRLLGRKK